MSETAAHSPDKANVFAIKTLPSQNASQHRITGYSGGSIILRKHHDKEHWKLVQVADFLRETVSEPGQAG